MSPRRATVKGLQGSVWLRTWNTFSLPCAESRLPRCEWCWMWPATRDGPSCFHPNSDLPASYLPLFLSMRGVCRASHLGATWLDEVASHAVRIGLGCGAIRGRSLTCSGNGTSHWTCAESVVGWCCAGGRTDGCPCTRAMVLYRPALTPAREGRGLKLRKGRSGECRAPSRPRGCDAVGILVTLQSRDGLFNLGMAWH
ncbi:hypothetical protein PZA11_007851 [Diplocarpon coronariae]